MPLYEFRCLGCGKKFTQLIGDLVHLSRDDQVQAHPEPIDLRDVVNNAVTRAKRSGPGLTGRGSPGLTRVRRRA